MVCDFCVFEICDVKYLRPGQMHVQGSLALGRCAELYRWLVGDQGIL